MSFWKRKYMLSGMDFRLNYSEFASVYHTPWNLGHMIKNEYVVRMGGGASYHFTDKFIEVIDEN